MALNVPAASTTDDLFIQANALLAQNYPEQAENLYYAILHLEKDSDSKTVDNGDRLMAAAVYHNLGMIAEDRGNIDSAITFYEKAVAINNNQGSTWLFLARAYLDKYRLQHNPRDIRLGRKAIQWAEASGCVYPAVGWLKIEYQKVS